MKFGIGQDWVPIKYDISIAMPETLDLSVLRGMGLQDGEEELPDTAPPPSQSQGETFSIRAINHNARLAYTIATASQQCMFYPYDSFAT